MAEAGLSRTIFYRHFDGLPELVLSLFDTVTQALMTEVQGAPGPGATRGILEAAVDAYAEHGGLLRAVDEAARHDADIETAYRAVVDAFTIVIASQIEEGMAAGRIRPGNAYELARALNLMNGNYLLETLGRDPDFDRTLAVDTLMAVWGPVASAE
jgi:AcrR family transcriptional regulator